MLRSGYGMSYIHFNRLGGENLLSFNGPHVVGAEHHAADLAAAVRRQPVADDLLPDDAAGLSGGLTTSPASFNTLNARVNYIPKDNPSGNVQSWHVSVQREIMRNLLVDVGYIGNKSRDIMILGDYNQARPNGADRERDAAGAAADPGLPADPDCLGRRQG